MSRRARRAGRLLPLALGLAALGLTAWPRRTAASPPCAAPYAVEWPAGAPVWSFCWVPPNQSDGVDGSGLEIRELSYRGRTVMKQGHLPVLNVRYDPGGCGGPSGSYRDWVNQMIRFEADNVVQPLYAEPTRPPVTTCEQPGRDLGLFTGVAVERRPTELVLTTQLAAGWYRYIQRWVFQPDGTIQLRLGFSAVVDPCTSRPHDHHAYFRLNLDVDGPGEDIVEEHNVLPGASLGVWTQLRTEQKRLRSPKTGRRWRVRDRVSGRGVEILPGPTDGVADAWAIADLWALRARATEVDDGGAATGPLGDRARLDRYLDGEDLDGKDVVLWYHAYARHDGAALDCEVVGPTLRPLPGW